LLEIAHQKKDQQNNEDKTETSTTSNWAPVGVPATAKKKEKNNDNED
jgi:hypothetical protein